MQARHAPVTKTRQRGHRSPQPRRTGRSIWAGGPHQVASPATTAALCRLLCCTESTRRKVLHDTRYNYVSEKCTSQGTHSEPHVGCLRDTALALLDDGVQQDVPAGQPLVAQAAHGDADLGQLALVVGRERVGQRHEHVEAEHDTSNSCEWRFRRSRDRAHHRSQASISAASAPVSQRHVFGLSVNFLNVGSQPCRPRSASFSFASSPSSSVHVLLEVTNHRPAESVDISLG